MKSRSGSLGPLALPMALCLCLYAQSSVPPQREKGFRRGWLEHAGIFRGMEALRVTIKLDRSSYLPGELICSKVTVENPSVIPIQAFRPFGPTSRSSIEIYQRGPIGDWSSSGNREYPITNDDTDGDIMATREVLWIAAGHALEASVCMNGSTGENQPRHVSIGRLVSGRYRLTFEYETPASSEFDIVPVLGSSGFEVLEIPEYERTREPRSGLPKNCLGAGVAALRIAGSTIIVEAEPIAACRPDEYERGIAPHAFAGFRRIAESQSGVKSLGLARADDGLRVSWTDGESRSHQLVIPLRKESE